MSMSVEQSVRDVVGRHVGQVAEDARLQLDSLELVALIEDLEDAVGVRVRGRDVTAENFGSLRRIIRYLSGIEAGG
jgi:acyl carrier protein